MGDKLDKVVIDIWQNTDDSFWLKKFSWFSDLAAKSAERQITKAKHDLIKKRWQKVRLSNKLNDLKQNALDAAENDQN